MYVCHFLVFNVQSEAFELLTNFWNNIVDMLTLEFATTARGMYVLSVS